MIPANLVKARLEEISWDKEQQVVEGKHRIHVQFNPDSLKVSFANQTSGGDQRGGSAIQFVGAGTTKLTFDLWFDVTNPDHAPRDANGGDGAAGAMPDDVRLLTEKVAFFIKPEPSDQKGKFIPPGVRFLWGRFLFEGIMESLNEELTYFSEDGRPLRAKVSVSLASQRIQFEFGNQAPPGAPGAPPGGRGANPAPHHQAKDGESVADAAAAAGNKDNWAAVARANGIENPRILAPGTVLDMSAAAGASAGFGAGAGAGFGAGAGASAGFGAGAAAGFGAGAGGSLGGGMRAGAAAGAGAGIGAGAGAGASAGLGAGVSAGLGAGVSAGLGGGASAGFGAGASAGFGAGASAGFGGGASAGFGAGAGAGFGGGTASFGGSTASLGGAAASAAARANASFDARLRR